ncbi:MAG: IreB family regulatory phosphoprotein [Clostridia bacterium]|nr:IreB family regulatory phosphoprotein [Clostridia bacterium]
MSGFDGTRKISLSSDHDDELKTKEILATVYDALVEKGFTNPLNQIVGYILSEDPTYITKYNNARILISRLDRYEILRQLLKNYLNIK